MRRVWASVSFRRRVRDSPGGLGRQFHDYGYWKYIVLRRHPRSLHLRWLAPPALVAALGVGVGFAWTPPGRRFLGVVGTAYLGTVAAGSQGAGRRVGVRLVPHASVALVTMHLAWGTGFLHSALGRRARGIAPVGPRVSPDRGGSR